MGGKNKSKKRLTVLHSILALCAFVLGGIYIFEANTLIEHQFARERMGREIAVLRDQTKQSEIAFSEISSLSNLKEMSSALNLTEAKNVSYIRVKSVSPLVFAH